MDRSLLQGSRGHRERPFKQRRAIRVWNEGSYRARETGKQGKGNNIKRDIANCRTAVT
ncbi:MAG: hypothetical protein ACRECU_13885 [Methylocella sp.]